MEISSRMIRVAAGDGTMPALLPRTDAVGRHPAVIRHLHAQEFVNADRIGITGFCMGGR